MKMCRINLNNIKIIYVILLLMNILCSIKGNNKSKSDNLNSEKKFLNKRKRKLEGGNFIKVTYYVDVEYSSGFYNEYRRSMDYIEYENNIFYSNSSLIILANTEIKIYFRADATDLSYFFSTSIDQNAKKIISADLSNFNTSSIIRMEYLFGGCMKLQTLILSSKFVTAKVERMDSMFNYCKVLQSLDLSNFDTSSVINMEHMFYECNALQTLTLSSKFVTSKVKK